MDFRKIDNFSDFENLVTEYIENRETLRTRVREERGDMVVTARVEQPDLTKLEASQAPTIKAIESLRKDLKPSKTYYNIFEKYANNPVKKTTEVKSSRKNGKLVLVIANNGIVDEEAIKDNKFRFVNIKTGGEFEYKLNAGLAELLFVPYKDMNQDKISNDAWIEYLQILQYAGINARAKGRNKKIKIGLEKLNRVPRNNEEKKQDFQDMDEEKQGEDVYKGEEAVVMENEGYAKNVPRKKTLKADIENRARANRPYLAGVNVEKARQSRADKSAEIRRQKKQQALSEKRRKVTGKRKTSSNTFFRDKDLTHLYDDLTGNARLAVEKNIKKQQGKSKIKSGTGLGLMTIDAMVSKLDLLTRSIEAGNGGAMIKNEMTDIIDVLFKDRKAITKRQHKILYNKYINF